MPTLENPSAETDAQLQKLDAISDRLVSARANARPLAAFPGRLPETLADAYAIQSASIDRWPDQPAGWKVGMVPGIDREKLAAERLAGPIFQSSILYVAPESTTTMPIYTGGFAAIEAEFVMQLATTVEPVAKQRSDEDLTGMISALHVGAEIASSPMADINALGPCCVVSDFGNNAGLLVGPGIPGWTDLPADSLTARVIVDGEIAGEATAAAIEGGLLQALRFLLDLCASREIALQAGTLVSCGAVTGIHEVTINSRASVDFGPFGQFDVAFDSMRPGQLQRAAGKS